MKSWRLLNSITRESKKQFWASQHSLCEMRVSWSHGCLGAAGVLARWKENTEPRFSVIYCTGGIFASLDWGVGKLMERKLSTLQHISSFERRIVFIKGVLCWILVSQSSSLWVMQCWSWDCPNASYACQAGGGRKMRVDLCLWAGFCQISTWVPSTLAAVPIGSLSRIYTASFIMLLTSGIIKSQDLSLRALGSGPQDSLFQPRGNSSS